MLVRVLGPTLVGPPGEPVVVATRKTRQVITLLALAAPATVSTDRLVDALWDEPPVAAVRTVQSHVSRARAALAEATGLADPIPAAGGGYALTVDRDLLDIGREEALRHAARDAAARGDRERARALLAEASALWRGEAELPDTLAGDAERAALRERRAALAEDHVRALLDVDRIADALVELDGLLAAEPLRENLWALRMLALYRSGRQVDALRTYADARRLLAEDVGVAPGPELRHLHAAILAHDAALAAPPSGIAAFEVDLPHYVMVDGRHVAYATFGRAGRDLLVLMPGFITIDAYLEEPRLAAALGRLAATWRVVALDRSGIGLSDPARRDAPPTVEHWVADVATVLDAVGATAVDVLANGDSCLVAMVLSAEYPGRVRAMTLLDPWVRATRADDYPHGFTPGEVDVLRGPVQTPGAPGPDHLAFVAPSVAGDDRFRAWWDRVGRRAASPATAALLHEVITSADVRRVLPAVSAPARLVVRGRCPSYDSGHARYLARHLAAAELVVTDGSDDLWWLGDLDDVLPVPEST